MWFNQIEQIFKEYIKLHEITYKKDNNIQIKKIDLYTKLLNLIGSKDYLLSCGVDSLAVNNSFRI